MPLWSFMTLSEPFSDKSTAIITTFYAKHFVFQIAVYSPGVTCYLILSISVLIPHQNWKKPCHSAVMVNRGLESQKSKCSFTCTHHVKQSFSSNQLAHLGVQALARCMCRQLLEHKPQVRVSPLLLPRISQGLRLFLFVFLSMLINEGYA